MTCHIKAALGLVLVLGAWPASAQLVVEAVPLTKRVVTIDTVNLASPAGRAAAYRQLRQAAKDVCAEQYPHETVHLFTRACIAGSYGAAAELLDEVASKQIAVAPTYVILVSAR